MKSPVHVRLEHSKYKRRLLLESTRTMIEMLRNHREFEEIQATKKVYIGRLKRVQQDIKEGIQLIDLKDIPEITREKKYKKDGVEEKRTEVHKAVDQLTSDLEEIERKLQTLQ